MWLLQGGYPQQGGYPPQQQPSGYPPAQVRHSRPAWCCTAQPNLLACFHVNASCTGQSTETETGMSACCSTLCSAQQTLSRSCHPQWWSRACVLVLCAVNNRPQQEVSPTVVLGTCLLHRSALQFNLCFCMGAATTTHGTVHRWLCCCLSLMTALTLILGALLPAIFAGWLPASCNTVPTPCRLPTASSSGSSSSACCSSRWHWWQVSSSIGWETTTAAASSRAWEWHDGDSAGGCWGCHGGVPAWRGTVKCHVRVSVQCYMCMPDRCALTGVP